MPGEETPQESARRVAAGLRATLEHARDGGLDDVPRTVKRDRAAPTELETESPGTGEDLAAIRADIGDCRRCKLAGGRTQIVFGVGSPNADVMFVGEGPGEEEDRRGEPFVGRAGQLLTDIITKGMGLSRDQVYIANVVKCRPPGNRNPEPDEIAACSPFLRRQIATIRPKVIVALGKFAAQMLAGVETPITRMRGRWHEFEGTKLMPTFHPSYLLRNPAAKREVWEDIQAVMREVGLAVPPGRPRS